MNPAITKVSILVPNYKTLELTKLCLRLLRKYTDPNLAEVIVIDNDSQDVSTEYLRSLNWIKLLERPAVPNEPPHLAHSRALDLALAQVATPYVLSIHTDTLVRNAQWLPYLLAKIDTHEHIAGIGSWKLENKPCLEYILKQVEEKLQKGYYYLLHKKQHAIEGEGDNFYYLRSHCALYRTDLLKQHQLTFSAGDGVAGKYLHKALLDLGYQMEFLASPELIKYIDHINHATMVLHPELGTRARSVPKGLKRIEKSLAQFNAQAILQDISLDQ